MTGLQPWLRGTRGVLLALFAVLFLAGPVLDSLVCAADGAAPAPAAQAAAAVVVDAASHHRAADDAQGLCQHGHAHAALGFAELQAPGAAPFARASALVRPVSARLPPSIAGPGLDRPPRA